MANQCKWLKLQVKNEEADLQKWRRAEPAREAENQIWEGYNT